MFDWFKKNINPTDEIKKVVIPCYCGGGNEQCDLILQLRNLQDSREKIKNEIQTLDKDSFELLVNFTNFLYKLEEHGMTMGSYGRHMTFERNVGIVKWVIGEYSSADILRITEELRTYRNKEDIINEKRRYLTAVENDIKNIKSKLGIE